MLARVLFDFGEGEHWLILPFRILTNRLPYGYNKNERSFIFMEILCQK
jgi:hypothetical protein